MIRRADTGWCLIREIGAAVAVALILLFGNTRTAKADTLVLDFRLTFPETMRSATMRCSTEARTLCRGQMTLLWDVEQGNIYLKFRLRDRYLFERAQPYIHLLGPSQLRDRTSRRIMLSEPPPLAGDDWPDRLYHRPVARLTEVLAILRVDIRCD